MASYTVEVREICENQYLANQKTANVHVLDGVSPREIIQNVYMQVLPSEFPVWDETTSDEVKQAILAHYYLREIGWETVGAWKFNLQTRLYEMMPGIVKYAKDYYGMGSIFVNNTGQETITRTGTDSNVKSGNEQTESTSSSSGKDGNQSLVSDTPQNGLSDVIEGNYLSSAEVNNGTSSASSSGTGTRDYGSQDTKTIDEKDVHDRSGFMGNKVDMIQQYAKGLETPMEKVIKGVSDMFIGILG